MAGIKGIKAAWRTHQAMIISQLASDILTPTYPTTNILLTLFSVVWQVVMG